MNIIGSALALATVIALTGCANPFAKFYQGAENARAMKGYQHLGDAVEVFNSDDFQRDGEDLARKGFVPIGRASFTADTGDVSTRQAVKHAQKIGAHVVLVRSQYQSTRTGVVPIYTPTKSTSYTNSSATAYGPRGSATAFGTSTTTTYGGNTNYVPYSVERSAFGAQFFAKLTPRFGVHIRPLSDEERQALESNRGVTVTVVVDDSPAFASDVLPGDILLSIDGIQITGTQAFQLALDRAAGRTVPVVVRRGANTITKLIPVLNI